MMNQRTIFLILCFFPLMQACKSENSEVLETLNVNRAKWESTQSTHYQFESQMSCFCTQEATAPRVVLVENNKITSLVNKTSHERLILSDYDTQTISELFHRIAIEESRAERLDVTYHPTLGYPTNVRVDGNIQIAHDEYSISVSNLILAEDAVCTGEEVPGVSLSIFVDGEAAACGVTITVTDAEHNMTTVNTDENCDASAAIPLLTEQDGYFDIAIAKYGYRTETLTGIGIGRDLCHVFTREISTSLTPTD